MKLLALLCAALFSLVASAARAADAAMLASAGWRAGVASVVITPKAKMWLAGYGARTHPATGTIQELHAKALALADERGGRFVLITVDLIGVPRELRQKVAEKLAGAYQLQPHQFSITASHTHSGPEFRAGRSPEGDRGGDDLARAYMTTLENALPALAGEALNALAPVRISYTHARAGFAMNRRLPQPKGDFTNAPNPDGPVDHDVPVLRVDGADGQLRAILFGYACHNTTLTQTNYEYCADYAGYAQQYLQADHPGAIALFMMGCAGDQNPYPRSTLPLAQAHGRTLATAVDAALGARGQSVRGVLRSAYGEIKLRYAEVPTAAELERRIAGSDKTLAEHASRMLARLKTDGNLPAEYPYPVQVVQLGADLKLVALGGEAVVDYSLRLKRELGGGSSSVWMAAYSNDVMGYIPSDRVLREGGYEGAQASRIGSLHPSPWAAGLEEQIVAKVHELVRSIR